MIYVYVSVSVCACVPVVAVYDDIAVNSLGTIFFFGRIKFFRQLFDGSNNDDDDNDDN